MSNLEKLKENAVWYDANLDTLLPKYRGRYIAISDGKVLGDYDDFDVGVDSTVSAGHALGTFMVHLCVPREEETPWICLSVRHGDFLITNSGNTEFSFRIPSEGCAPI